MKILTNRYLTWMFFAAFVPLQSYSQEVIELLCPVKEGTITVDTSHFDDIGLRFKYVSIVGADSKVTSCIGGRVVEIDSTNEGVYVRIETGEYIISYYRLASSNVKIGRVVHKGELIGNVLDRDRLALSIIKNKRYIDPTTMLKCVILYRK